MDSDGVWKTPWHSWKSRRGNLRFPHPLGNAARFPHCPQPRRRESTFSMKAVIHHYPSPSWSGGPVYDDQMGPFSSINV